MILRAQSRISIPELLQLLKGKRMALVVSEPQTVYFLIHEGVMNDRTHSVQGMTAM